MPNQGAPLPDPEVYKKLVGSLLYLSLTRPDITYLIQQLSQFMQLPCQSYLEAAYHVLKYLKGNRDIFFSRPTVFTCLHTVIQIELHALYPKNQSQAIVFS